MSTMSRSEAQSPAADDVAGAGGGDGDFVLRSISPVKKRISIGAGDQFRTGLAVAVGIVAAERIVFAVGPDPLLDSHSICQW